MHLQNKLQVYVLFGDFLPFLRSQITNLMSVDSQRFKETVPSVNFLWSAPVQFALGTYFLYDLVGVSAFAGLSVLLLCLPANLLSARCVCENQQIALFRHVAKISATALICGLYISPRSLWNQLHTHILEGYTNCLSLLIRPYHSSSYLWAHTAF